jgi:uncharacterized protein YoxC
MTFEYTPDQLMFVESFTKKRDELTGEVGMLTYEQDKLLQRNQELAEINAALKKDIADMQENSAKIGFEAGKQIADAQIEVAQLKSDIELLITKKSVLTEAVEEKTNSLRSLSLVITSIKTTTEDTTDHIRKISNDLNVYSGRIEAVALATETEAGKIKGYVNELSTTVDNERKVNYLKTKELDDRENAIILRERILKSK